MNELERLKQRVGLSTPTNQYSNRKLGTYKPYEEDEEEKERKQLESQVEAIKTIANEQKPITEVEDKRYKSHTYREAALGTINKKFGETLANDIEQTVQYKRGLGMTDAQIQEQFIPIEDRPLDKLAQIESKLKKGKEQGFYKVQEGYYQYEVMNIRSNESNKAMHGLPNRLDEVNSWIASHPELEMEEKEFELILAPGLINNPKGIKSKSLQEADNLMGDSTKPIQGFKLKEGVGLPIDSTIRFMGATAQLGLASAKKAAENPMTWVTIGLMMATSGASSALLASKGAAASKFINVPLVNKSLQLAKNLTTMQQFKYGVGVGRAKYMMDLEAGSAYAEYIESGVHPEVAKQIAKTVGAANGVIEYLQFGQLTKALPGVKNFAQATTKIAQDELKTGLFAMGKAWGVDIFQNVGEEMLQESNTALGLALSQYMTQAPNPNTIEGLKVLATTMGTEEYRDRIAATAIESALSVWGLPLASSVGSFAVNRTITKLEQSAAKKAAYGWYTEEEKQTKAYQDEAKKVLPYTVEILAKDAKENKSEGSVRGLAATVTILEEIEQRPDLSNEDKAIMSDTKQKANEAIAKVEFDVKSENPDIEIATTNKQDIEQKIIAGELPKINPNLSEVVLEFRQKAKDKGIFDTIKNGLLEGKRKSEISAEVEKLLPRKERNAIGIMQYINSVEIVEQEIKYQFNAASIANLMSVKDSLKTQAPEQPTTNETEVSQPTDSLDTENLTTDIVEPVEGNEGEEGGKTKEVWEMTAKEYKVSVQKGAIGRQKQLNGQLAKTFHRNIIKNALRDGLPVPQEVLNEYPDLKSPIPKEPLEVVEGKFAPTEAVKVPVTEIKLDPKRFQFRFNGTTNRMEGLTWNDKLAGTILLWESEYEDLYVVNGHHRVMAAKENNIKTLDAKILRGITAEEARAEGAILNIAEGSADAFDTAKFLRDTNSTLEDLTKLGVPPKSKIARDGANLAKLEDNLFHMAAVKKIPYERAVMIGRELGDDKVAQRQFYDMMVKEEAKRGYLKDSTIDAMLSQVKAVGAVEYFQESLLGAEDTKSAVVERAELVAYVKDNLKNKKSVLKKITKTKNAKMLEQLGNKINTEDNVEQMELADQALYLLDKTVNAKDSKVSKMFNELAVEYAKTGDKKVLDKALKLVGDLMETGELLQEALGKDKAKAELIDALEEIDGQADMFSQFAQIKEMPSIKVIAKKGTNEDTHAKLMPLIEIMEKNPIFNGLEIIFTGQESTRFMDRSELDAKGYRNYKPGYYTEYGSFRSLPGAYIDTRTEGDNAQRTNQGDSTGDQLRNNQYTPKTGYTRGNISLTNSAQVDTLLHEAIHSIQDILERVDPEFSVLVKAWETEIFELAKEQGIELPQGKEMLAHALMLGEFGYANDSFELAKAVEVPTEIIDRFKDMLGKEFVNGAKGESKADSNRKLKADYKKIADINLQSTEIAQSISQARNRRLNKIKMDLRAGQPIRYYSPDSTTYAIAVPKDTNYEVSFFNEQGLLTKAEMGIDKLAKKLSDMKLYYNPGEVSYQLKQFDRTQIDEVVTGNDLKDISNIVRAFENARVGNFTASDYDNFVKGKLNEADSQDLLKAIMNSAEKGLDKPNSEVTIQEYVNRFYPQRMESNDYGMRERDGKIEFFYKAYDEMSPYRTDEIVPIKVLGTFDSVTEAIKAYRDWTYLNRDLSTYKDKAFNRQFYYMPDYWDQLQQEYEDFKANYETYRHDYSTDFDGQPKFNISYQLKEAILNDEDSKLWRFPKHRGELTLQKIERYLREGSKNASYFRTVNEFASAEVLKDRLFWHGTGGYVSGSLKAGFRIAEDRRGGGYGEIQHTISISKSKKVASNFSGQSNSVSIYPVVIKEGAKIIDMPEIQDAIELEDILLDLWNDKVDAVAIGDWDKESGTEKELVIINPRIIAVGQSETHQVYGIGGKIQEPTMEEIQAMYDEVKARAKELAEKRQRKFEDKLEEEKAMPIDGRDVIYDPNINYQLKSAFDNGRGNEVFYWNDKVEVIKNPTSDQYRQMHMEVLKQYPHLRGQDFPTTRTTYDNEGNSYIWKSMESVHGYIEPFINEKYGVTTNQNRNFQLKSAIDVEGFYSNLERVLDEKLGSRGKATDILNMLNKNGVKPEEMEWFRIPQFLEGKNMVTKEEILEHMQERRIEFSKIDMGTGFQKYTLHDGQGGSNYRFNAYTYDNNPGQPFMKSAHFGNKENVIAHTRYMDRTTQLGEKVLFIEEMQSDWHQEGRDKGYGLNDEMAAIISKYGSKEDLLVQVRVAFEEDDYLGFDKIHEAADAVQTSDLSNFDSLSVGIQRGIYQDYKDYMRLSKGLKEQVPDAPLKESITDFMFKTAIKDAVQGGYDRIAWTTGEQQADRYNMRQVAERIEWRANDTKVWGDLVGFDVNGKETFRYNDINEASVEELLGKNLANELISQEMYEDQYGYNTRALEREGLEIGGEFHKKLYNNYIPRMVKKYAKRWGISPEVIEMGNWEPSQDREWISKDWLMGMDIVALIPMIDNTYLKDMYEEMYQEAVNESDVERQMLIKRDIADTIIDIHIDNWHDVKVETTQQLSIPVTPQMIEDVMSNGQPLFQIKELVAVHNLGAGELKSTVKLGGIVMPSIAVTLKNYLHDRYGEISLLFNKNTIDPRANKDNRVYSGDAYTPEFPSIRYKINDKEARTLRDRVKSALAGTQYMNEYRDTVDATNIEDRVNREGSFEGAYKYDPLLMLTYLKENSIEFEPVMRTKNYEFDVPLMEQLQAIEGELINKQYLESTEIEQLDSKFREVINKFYGVNLYKEAIGYGKMDRLHDNIREFSKDTTRETIDGRATETKLQETINHADYTKWFNEVSKDIIEAEGIRNNRDIFTNSGTRRGWNALHDPVTLDNILKVMKAESETASGMFGGVGQFGAAVSRKFTSIADIKAAVDRLSTMDEETYNAMREDFQERLIELASRIKDNRESNRFIAIDHAFDAMVDAFSNGKGRAGVVKILNEYPGLNITEDAVDEMMQLADEVAQMPTEYFEAKPRRIVGLEEIQAVIMPLDTDPELIQMLKDRGIHLIEFYDKAIEGDRQRAMDEVLGKNDVSFQIKPTPTDTEAFKKWFKDSKVVDENGQPLVVFHGSPRVFSSFRPSYAPGWGEGIYFTDNSEAATEYAYTDSGETRPLYEVYLSITNPYTEDKRPSYATLENTRAFKDRLREIPMEDGEYEYVLSPTELFNEDVEFANEVIRELGYDGIIAERSNGIDGREIVVFSPTQIKSVYNTGAWSATNADMYYQIKGETDMEERSWSQTVRDSGITDQWLSDLLTDNKFMYEVAHNEDSVLAGAKLIQDKGEEYVIQKIKGKFEADAKLFAASQILTYKYMEGGERDLAMDILAATAAKATTAGQAIQILSVWNKQTPEGMLRNVRKDFDGLSTEAQKKELERLYEEIKKEAKRINKVAVTKLKLQKALEKLEAMSQQEMDTLEIAQSELKTAQAKLKQKVKTQKKTVLTGDIKKLIMQTITDHYNGEGGSLFGKLKGLGLNDLEVRQLVDFTNAEMKALTEGENLNAIQRLIKGKGDAVDKQISDLMAEGKYGDAMKAAIGQKKGIPVLTQDMVDFIYERGKEINSLPEGSRERIVASARLIRDIMEQMPVAKSRKIATIQTMAQLLNIKTTLRNLIGNSAFRRLDTLTLNTIGAAVDTLMISKTGQRVQLARLADAKKKQKEGYRIGWAEGKQDAIEGINTTESATKFELKANRTFKRNTALGQAETVLNLALRATDRAAFTASYLDSLEEQMLIEGVTEPTDLMHERATAIALYRTFNDSTKLSKGFKKIKEGANQLAGNEEFGLGDFILKYPKTPANILGRAIDYSPAGFVVTAFKLLTDTSGDPYIKQRIKVDGISRAIMGSGVMAMGAILARLGILTGSNPDDEDEEVYKMKKQAGLRDFSVNTSALWRVITSGFTDEKAGELREGDILASYDWFEPMAMGLAIGADTVLGKGESFNALSTVIRAWEVGATALADQPLLSGIANIFRYGDVVGGLTNIALQAPASFVPSLLSHTAQAIDGRNTDPYTNYGEAEKAWNLIKNKLPIARGTIPSRIDALGVEQRYFPEDELIPVTVFKSMVSPAIINRYAPSEDMQALVDLYQETEDVGVIPRTRTSFTKDKVKYNPKPGELESMRKWLGESTRLEISRALNGYAKGWDSQSQADEVGSIINKMWEEAKTKYVRGDFN